MNPVHYSFERPLLSIPIFTAPFGPHQRLPSLPNNHSPLLQATFTLPALSIFQGTRGWGKERLTLSFPSLDAFTNIQFLSRKRNNSLAPYPSGGSSLMSYPHCTRHSTLKPHCIYHFLCRPTPGTTSCLYSGYCRWAWLFKWIFTPVS